MYWYTYLATEFFFVISTDRDAYRLIESNHELRKKMESVIAITDLGQTTSANDPEKFNNLDEFGSSVMAKEEMKALQYLTQKSLDHVHDSQAQQTIPFLIALSNTTKSMIIKHHLYKVFRQLLYKTPILDPVDLDALWMTPMQQFDILQGDMMKFLSIIQTERENNKWGLFPKIDLLRNNLTDQK